MATDSKLPPLWRRKSFRIGAVSLAALGLVFLMVLSYEPVSLKVRGRTAPGNVVFELVNSGGPTVSFITVYRLQIRTKNGWEEGPLETAPSEDGEFWHVSVAPGEQRLLPMRPPRSANAWRVGVICDITNSGAPSFWQRYVLPLLEKLGLHVNRKQFTLWSAPVTQLPKNLIDLSKPDSKPPDKP